MRLVQPRLIDQFERFECIALSDDQINESIERMLDRWTPTFNSDDPDEIDSTWVISGNTLILFNASQDGYIEIYVTVRDRELNTRWVK